MQRFNNEWMTVKSCKTIGPEFGIGHLLGDAMDAPVMLLKSCIGNRSLGWDLLPPGSERYEFLIKDKAGAEKIIDLLNWSEESQVKVITLWLLSNQNLSRPIEELKPLLEIIGETVSNLAAQHRWKIRPVGSMEILPFELKVPLLLSYWVEIASCKLESTRCMSAFAVAPTGTVIGSPFAFRS